MDAMISSWDCIKQLWKDDTIQLHLNTVDQTLQERGWAVTLWCSAQSTINLISRGQVLGKKEHFPPPPIHPLSDIIIKDLSSIPEAVKIGSDM